MYQNSYLLKCNLFSFVFIVVFGSLSAQELTISATQLKGHWFNLYAVTNDWVGSKRLVVQDTLNEDGFFAGPIDGSQSVLYELDFGWRQVSFYWSGKDSLKIQVDSAQHYYDFTEPLMAHVWDTDEYDSLFSVTEFRVSEAIQHYYSQGNLKQNWSKIHEDLAAQEWPATDSLIQLNFNYAIAAVKEKNAPAWVEEVNNSPLNFQLPALVQFHELAKEHFGGSWFVEDHDLIKNVMKNGQGYALLDTLAVTKYQDLHRDKMHMYLLMNLKVWKKDMGVSTSDLQMYVDYLREVYPEEVALNGFLNDYEEVYLSDSLPVVDLDSFSFVNLPSQEWFDGRYVYLMSWSTWSRYSTERLELLNRLQENYKETIVFVAVNVDEEYGAEVTEIEDQFPDLIFSYCGNRADWLKEWSWMTNSPPNYILLDGTGNVVMYNALDVLDMLKKFDEINDAHKQQKIDLMQNGIH